MTLLLGPPGSGKTTLLLALAGKLDKDLKVRILFGLDVCLAIGQSDAKIVLVVQVLGKVTYNGHTMKEFVPQRSIAQEQKIMENRSPSDVPYLMFKWVDCVSTNMASYVHVNVQELFRFEKGRKTAILFLVNQSVVDGYLLSQKRRIMIWNTPKGHWHNDIFKRS